MERLAIPLFGPGTRAEVCLDDVRLICRTARMQGRTLHLAVPAGAIALASRLAPGKTVALTLYRAGACWEAQATLREWVRGAPDLLIVGPVYGWEEKPRRSALRMARTVAACLVGERGDRCCGRTEDVSRDGVSLRMPGGAPLDVGVSARMTLQLTEDSWCEEIPIRITRIENWVSADGRSLRVGATVGTVEEMSWRRRWEACLRFLDVGEEEEAA